MPLYDVTISRTEIITFRVEADSPEEADNDALGEGDEIGSKTSSIETVGVELVTSIPVTYDLSDTDRVELLEKLSDVADIYGPMTDPLIPSTPPTAYGHALELHESKARAAHEAAREARLAGETHYVWLDRRIEGFVVPRSDPNVYERPADLLFDNADDAQAWRDDEILDAEDCHDVKRWVLCRRDITVIS